MNCCVCVLEVHPATGSTTTEVTLGWTVTVNALLVTPWAVAVMLAEPLIALPDEFVPLHTIKLESHTPAHSSAEAAPFELEMVTTPVLEELKLTLVVTGFLEASSGVAAT